MLISALLLLPKPWKLSLLQTNSIIEVEIIESQPASVETIKTKPTKQPLPKPDTKPNTEPNTKATVRKQLQTPSQAEDQVIKAAPKEIPTTQTESRSQEKSTTKTIPTIKTGEVLQMMQNRKSIDITADFQARTEPAKDFYIPEQEIHDWLADIPYLDESVDKPKLQMNFYSAGMLGGVERFFDKITIQKTFTTKYGTKIHCALVGILVACSWK